MAEMILFRYLGETGRGSIERGEVLAAGAAQARQQLLSRGLAIVELTPVGRGDGNASSRSRLTTSMTTDFIRMFADLVASAVPVPDALLHIVEAENRRPIRMLAQRVERAVRTGASLSEALAEDPARPPRLLVATIAAGEQSGQLGVALDSLAGRMERARELREMMVGQLIYPLILVGVIFLTLLFLSFFILPQFEAIFEAASAVPPAETRFVLAGGAFFRVFGVWVPVMVVALAWLAQVIWRANPVLGGRVRRGVPILGSALAALDVAGFSRTMGTLLSTGVPLVRAAEVARDAVSDIAVRIKLGEVIELVRRGLSLSQALTRAGVMPDDLVRQVRLGEATGELDRFFTRAAVRYERDAESRIKRMVELLGPSLIVLLGACVGGVIAAVLSGVLSLNDAIY